VIKKKAQFRIHFPNFSKITVDAYRIYTMRVPEQML